MKFAHESKRGAHKTARPWLLLGALPLIAIAARPQEDQGEQVEVARNALSQWVETQRLISKERADWQEARQMMESRIRLVQGEIEALGERIAAAQASVAEADAKRAELVHERDVLKSAADGLLVSIGDLETRTKALLPRLPAPLMDIIRPLSQGLPEDPNETKLGLGQRFQNVVGILNQVDRYHRQISLSPEVRTLADGRAAEVTAMYIGISQGYYASNDGTVAGMGGPTANGWQWTPANDAAAEIAAAIAILKNERLAEFVPMPLTVQ